ncbi:MAG TPA: Tn3 family transposase [Kofleriaceae bacterium]
MMYLRDMTAARARFVPVPTRPDRPGRPPVRRGLPQVPLTGCHALVSLVLRVPPRCCRRRADAHRLAWRALTTTRGQRRRSWSQSTDGLTVDVLHEMSKWFLRTDTLKAANRVLVDYHHRLPLSSAWGDGTAVRDQRRQERGVGPLRPWLVAGQGDELACEPAPSVDLDEQILDPLDLANVLGRLERIAAPELELAIADRGEGVGLEAGGKRLRRCIELGAQALHHLVGFQAPAWDRWADVVRGAIEACRLEAREPAGVRLGGGGDAV